jgi:hypothetical protein
MAEAPGFQVTATSARGPCRRPDEDIVKREGSTGWHWRRACPDDMAGALGKEELMKSLRTSS